MVTDPGVYGLEIDEKNLGVSQIREWCWEQRGAKLPNLPAASLPIGMP